ncbi:hypothetical protein R1sor_015891 [Riccia sorocarpa]|uniref:C-terminal of Roc (COR) domain-containing protein n=1 Tax=Riccia sorocarpa TaxID=122646 RepID=A0ABD3HDH7_9MARC
MDGGRVESSTVLKDFGVGDNNTKLQVVAVVALLRRLKSKSTSSSVASISRKDLQADGFSSIFGGSPDSRIAFLSVAEIKKIRLRVFRAIGKCSTLTNLDLSEDEEFPINLTGEELQALLDPLENSTSLVILNLDGQAVLSTSSGAQAVGTFVGANRSCQLLSTRIPTRFSGDNIGATESLTQWLNIFLKAGDVARPLIYWHGLGPQITAGSAFEILRAFPNLRAIYWEPETVSQWQCHSSHPLKNDLKHISLDSVSLIGRLGDLGTVMTRLPNSSNQLRVFRIYCTGSYQGNYIEGTSGWKLYDPFQFEEGYHGYPEPNPETSVTKEAIRKSGDWRSDDDDQFGHDYNLGENVAAMLSRSGELESVGLYRLEFTSKQWEMIFRALRKSPRLRKFGCSCDLGLGFDEGCWEKWIQLVQNSSKLKFLKLESSPVLGTRFRLGVLNILEAMKSNQVVERLALNHFRMEEGEVRALARLIEVNSHLKELSLASCQVTGQSQTDVEVLFRSLGRNRSLRKLDLSGVRGLTDKAFRELTAVLLGPSLIQAIEIKDTIWEREGKKPMLERALEQALHQANYLQVMRTFLVEDKLMLAKTGRLFLCGEPYSGKTELRKSLVKLATKVNSSRLRITRHLGLPAYRDSTTRRLLRRRGLQDKRTNGVEIELCLIDGMQICIWDLAGQEIFRALHDCIFPTFNTTSVFLFVFSPYDVRTKRLKFPLSTTLRVEFLPWLRFIASNSQAAKRLPPVKILISHMDKLETADLHLGWAEEVAIEMDQRFQDLLAVDVRVLGADNRVLLRGVDTVLQRTRESFKYFLETTHIRAVPQACCEITDALCSRKIAGKSREAPVLQSEDFFSFCEENASSLQKYQNDPEARELLMNAIAEYLHDAGIIIRLPGSGLVVVDPNWLTCSFLGQLIGLGHGFISSQVGDVGLTRCSGGLITKAHFQELLLTLVERLKWKNASSTRDVVQQLQAMMEEMDLCFEVRVDDAVEEDKKLGIFAPILFAEPGENSSRFCRLPEWNLCGSLGTEPSCVGLRVQCRDPERTRLTSSFFPRLQVFFRNFMLSKHSRFEDLLICQYNLMTLTVAGHEIHIENDRMVNGDHIDILARSYNSHNDAMLYVLQNVVEVIQRFCASPKGCPGIALSVSVMRSDCVKNLTPSFQRDEKVVVEIESLISEWKAEVIRKVLSEDYSDTTDSWGEYIHTWPAVDTAGLPMLAERARDLLMGTHMREVVRSVGDVVSERRRRVKSVEQEVARLFSSSSTNPVTSDETSRLGLEYVCEEGGPASDLKNSGDVILEVLDEVKGIVMEVLSEVKRIRGFQESFQRTLLSLSKALDRLSGYSSSNQEIPKRPYFISASVGLRHYITARIRVGTALTLHFMCERRSGHHYVEGQEGYPLVVEKDNMDVLRFLSTNSIKTLAFLVKAGINVGAMVTGVAFLGNFELPGPGEYMALTEANADELLKKLKPSERLFRKSGKQRSSKKIDVVQESWAYLKQLFLSHLKDRCQELFQLYRCRYSLILSSKEGESSSAWLCKNCFLEGLQNGSVEECR